MNRFEAVSLSLWNDYLLESDHARRSLPGFNTLLRASPESEPDFLTAPRFHAKW